MSDDADIPADTGKTTELARRAGYKGRGELAPLWRKGQSGNPSGIGYSEYHEARKVCALHTQEAIARQIRLMRESDYDHVVMVATEAIINRGIGKARDHSTEQEGGRLDLTALTPEERKAMAEMMMKALGL